MEARTQAVVRPVAIFEPFELVLRVDSIEEAQGLWHRFNKPYDGIIKHTSIVPCLIPPSAASNPREAWRALNKEMERQGILHKTTGGE